MDKQQLKALLAGSLLATGMSLSADLQAQTMENTPQSWKITHNAEASDSDSADKGSEHKCGEGKCGEKSDSEHKGSESKCGEGSCG